MHYNSIVSIVHTYLAVVLNICTTLSWLCHLIALMRHSAASYISSLQCKGAHHCDVSKLFYADISCSVLQWSLPEPVWSTKKPNNLLAWWSLSPLFLLLVWFLPLMHFHDSLSQNKWLLLHFDRVQLWFSGILLVQSEAHKPFFWSLSNLINWDVT